MERRPDGEPSHRVLLESAFRALPDDTYTVNVDGGVGMVSRAVGGRGMKLPEHCDVFDFLDSDSARKCLEMIHGTVTTGEPSRLIVDGSDFVVPRDGVFELRWVRLNETEALVIMRDVTLEQRAMASLQHQAVHDGLTGLPNRQFLTDHLQGVHDNAAVNPTDRKLGVGALLIDLDDFKQINDTFGHSVGDEFLRSVAQRLREVVRNHEVVVRIGGDEFVVVVCSERPELDARAVAERISDAFCHPVRFGAREVMVSASIGIAVASDVAELDVDAIFRFADAAMYRAKGRGRGQICVFDSTLMQDMERRTRIEVALYGVLSRGELAVHYQPIFDARTRDVAGHEALVRWQSPELGTVAPSDFIPIAEELGMVPAIGEWAMRTAATELMATAQVSQQWVSINVSAHQLASPYFADGVMDLLHRVGIAPECLQLEITETALIKSFTVAHDHLSRLRRHGIAIAIDDFGTGYSSLTYLRDLPVDQVKIDRTFVERILSHDHDLTIVGSTIELAHSLGCAVIAEGIESSEQIEALDRLGVDFLQGYGLGAPGPTMITPSDRALAVERSGSSLL